MVAGITAPFGWTARRARRKGAACGSTWAAHTAPWTVWECSAARRALLVFVLQRLKLDADAMDRWSGALLAMMLCATLEARALAADACLPDAPLVYRTKRRDLGHGYALYNEGYRNPPGHWEGIAHYSCLHFDGRGLAITNRVSFSPSGKFLLFDDAPAGTWVLGDAIAGRHVVVGKQDADKLQHFEAIVWDEREGSVSVTYSNNLPSTSFDLDDALRRQAAPTNASTPITQR
jgi:hypothetical protein